MHTDRVRLDSLRCLDDEWNAVLLRRRLWIEWRSCQEFVRCHTSGWMDLDHGGREHTDKLGTKSCYWQIDVYKVERESSLLTSYDGLDEGRRMWSKLGNPVAAYWRVFEYEMPLLHSDKFWIGKSSQSSGYMFSSVWQTKNSFQWHRKNTFGGLGWIHSYPGMLASLLCS